MKKIHDFETTWIEDEEVRENFCGLIRENLENVAIFRPAVWNFGDTPSDGVGGPPVEDPLMLYVDLALGDGESGPVLGVSLTELVQDDLEASVDCDGRLVDDEGRFGQLRDALRRLADHVDDVIRNGLET